MAPLQTESDLLLWQDLGGNFLDAAEMYPVPSSDPRWFPGRTEEIIGNWYFALSRFPSLYLVALFTYVAA